MTMRGESTSSEQMAAMLAAQKAAARANGATARQRIDRLDRVIALLRENGEALVQALSADFGHRSLEQSWLTDIVGPIRQAKHARKNLGKWMQSERRPLDFPLGLLGARAWIEYQPKGVVGVIAPWNFPVQLAIGPLVGVFAAGNRAMVKASELTPATAALLTELAARYFAAEELCFVNGGPEVGNAFAELPFDHLIFTGSGSVGRRILQAAATHMTPVTLELGGKSPAIIGRTADIDRATGRIAWGKMLNAGQVCIAPDYLLVPREMEPAVIASITKSVSSMYPTMLNNPDYTAVVSARHRDRLHALIEDARAKGGEVIEVNPAQENFSATNVGKMPLYLIRNPHDDMLVMQEEIFGPILPVLTYDRFDEAIAYVNAHPHPLALYCFGDDAAETRQVLEKTTSGGVTINDVIFHITADDLPFGGIGPSGMGAYHGLEGFRTFSHARSVYSQPKINVTRLAGYLPPYGKATQGAIRKDLKT